MNPSLFQPILACATCMGDASDHATRAAGVSIFFLLLVILCVGGACVRFFLFLARCERRATAPASGGPRASSSEGPRSFPAE